MDPGIDDPDERRFQQFAEQTSRNVNDASEVVRALDERIGAIKADCQETDEKSWLIYRLQRQRLLYARYHVRKVAILKKLADRGTLTLPGDEMENIAREARDLRQMTTEDVRLMEDHLRRHTADAGHGHSTSFHQHSHGNQESKRETWKAYFNALFDRLHGSHHREEDETTTRRNCDTIEAARRFYAEQFARGFEPISDHHEDDSWVTSRETILFGGNETSNGGAVGASANATIERRDHYRDQRQVTDEEIRYVHEHVRSYRLEATLQRDQWSEISAELQRLYEKDPDLFRKHFGDEQPWKHFPSHHHHHHGKGGNDSDDDQDDHRDDDFETIKIVDTQSTTATSRDDTASISVSLTSRDESAIFEEDEEADDATTHISSNGTTPTPTVELVRGRHEHGHLLLRADDLELAPLVFETTTHIHEGGRTSYTIEEEEEEIEHTRRRLPQPEAPTQVLIYEGSMVEKPLIIVLDRYPYEWYYEVLPTPHVHSIGETQVLTEISETAERQKVLEVIEPLGQPEPKVRTEVLWRRSELPYMKMDERRRVSEFGELIFTHEIEETTEHSPKIRRRPVEFDDRPLSQEVDLPLGQGVSKYEVLSYGEFSEHPLVVSIDTYPHEWYYELLPEPVVVYDEFGRAVHETTTRFDIEEEVTTERSPKIRRRRPDDILHEELTTLYYTEFVPHPLIISLDRYPREWWYEHVHHEHPTHQQPLELPEQRQHILEEGVSHIGYEIEETFEQSPAIRHIKELEELVRSPTVELPFFEERLVFHLLNYDQDMPHLPFHIRRRPVVPLQEPIVEPIRIERVIEEVKTLLLRESEMLQSPLLVQQVLKPLEPLVVIDEKPRQQEEVGRLILRETEFGRYPLDSYLSQRPTTFEWIPMSEQPTRSDEFPLGQPEPTFTGHVVYRERPLSHTPETALWLLEPTHDLAYSIYEPVVEIRHLPQHVETGRLLLRDNEFGPWPLSDYIHQRPDYFEYDLHYHVRSHAEYKYEEIPLGQQLETPVGTLEYVEHVQSVWIVQKPLEILPQPAPRRSTQEHETEDIHLPHHEHPTHKHHHEHEHLEHEHLHHSEHEHTEHEHPEHSKHHGPHFHLPDIHLPHFHLPHHEHKEHEHEKPEHEHEHLHKHPEHETHHHEHPHHSKHEHEHHGPHFHLPDIHLPHFHLPHHEHKEHEHKEHEHKEHEHSGFHLPHIHLPHIHLGHHKHHKPSTEEPEHVIYDLPPSEVYDFHYTAEMPSTVFEVEKRAHYELPPLATVYDEPPVFVDFPTWGQSHQHDYELIYRPDFDKHPLVIEERIRHVYELPVEQPARVRSETKRSEDFLLLRNDDLDNLPYTHGRPPSLSYTNIGETRRSRTSTAVSELSDVQLLWRRSEFRASLYEPNRRVVVEREVRRETDPIVRRQPSASTAASDIQELRRSTSEVGRSMSSISSDTVSSVYDQHLFLRLEMPFTPLVISRVPPPPLTFEPEERERGVPPRRPLEPIPSLPTPVVSPVEKAEFLRREEEMEPSERIEVHNYDYVPRDEFYYEPVPDYEDDLLHKDHEFHSHPLDYAIYEMPPYVAKAEEEFERVMAEPHVHPHMEPISSDPLRLTLPSEHLEPLISDEDLYSRPLELPRRKTDEDIEVLLHRTAEMDELLFDEVWHLLDSTRPHRRRLSEIQEETMSFGPESNANSKSSSDRGPIGTTTYHELPQLKFEQYGNTAPIYDVPSVESPSSQALSPDYPHHQHQLYYAYDLTQIPLEFESTDLPPTERPPPIPEELAGHSDFSSSSSESESDVEHVEADHEYEVTEFRSHESVEPIYAEIGPHHVHEQPPQLPKTLPPQRTKQPLETLPRDYELPHESIRIYDVPYQPTAKEREPPSLPPPLEPIESPKTVVQPVYDFPNVKKMAEAYSRQHEHRDVPVIPVPRLHRIWPHEELSYVRFQATSVAPLRVLEPQEPTHQHQPTHQVHRHPRRDTIEFETASNYERSPVPVRATERFRHGHFADEIHAITESQLATPIESESSVASSPAPSSVGRFKHLRDTFDSPSLPQSPLAKLPPTEQPAVRFQATSVAPLRVLEPQKPTHQHQPTHQVHRHKHKEHEHKKPLHVIDEIVRIGGEEFGIVEKLEVDGRTYSIERHSDLRRLLAEYHIEDTWLDRYVRSQPWQIPMFLVPGAHKRLELPIRPTSRRRISLGLMLRRTQLSASAPGGLDHLHINDVFQQIEPIGQPTPSETSWSVRSPTRSRSSPFVHRHSHVEVEETNELLQNPAFIRARQHADAFAWGSIHRKQGREIASVLHRADSETAESISSSKGTEHDKQPTHHHIHDEKPHQHVYDTVYEEPHRHRDSVDHYAEPIPVRRLTQTTAPSLPSTPPPKTPPAFSLKSAERPLSIAERLLTKTPSFEHRHRNLSGTAETPSEHSEQRLTPFGSRRSFTSERRKWLGDEEEETEAGSAHDEAEELHRAVHGLRHVEPPKAATERSAVHSDEERENREEFARVQLRHVESGSLRRKRRLEHRETDPYIRHPTEPDFVPGLHFPKRRFLTYLLRAPPIRGRARYYNKMPELTDGLQFMNGVVVADELLDAIDNEQTAHIDPTSLLHKMYTVDYNPLVETRTRFRSMEGHMEVPNDEAVVEPIEKPWKSLYFRIRDGRFQWFASHGADEHPMGDVLLVDTKITASTSDWTFKVEGGKENANLYVRAPSNVFEKWRIALLSNSASQLIDAYVHPARPVVPHYTQKVMFIDIGRCSIRAGIHTNKPSLPQSFFPAIASIADDSGQLTVGIDALKPEVRRRGRLHRPLEDGDGSSTERVRLNSQVVEACVRKAIDDLKLQPETFKVLLSVAQDVPAIHVAPLLRILLETIGFQAATIARQPSLILFSYDVTTGVVVDLGERLHIVPVIDEYIVDSAVISLPFGAAQIRSAVRKRLEGGEAATLIDNPSAVAHVALREAVRQACFVSADVSNESAKAATVELGDLYGKKITVDEIRYEATEGFFDPQRWGLELKGLHRLIHDVIQQSPIDSRRTLYRNIYLAGGTSLLLGLAERLETELGKVAPASIFVQVHGSPWRYHAGYLGAQVLANSHSFNQCFAEKTNLDEYIKQIETEVS
ncbi:hypothetical protein M3Y94_00994900 [Aphelenchoides besseyi]|nr:hypothetical protein M3Y94_00994900 [Aphelenchoides besseyi]